MEPKTIFLPSFLKFHFLYSRLRFAFQKPFTFCIPKTPPCIHQLGFNISNWIVKFKMDFLLLKKLHSVITISYFKLKNDVEISYLHSETVFPYFEFKKIYYLKTDSIKHFSQISLTNIVLTRNII